MGGAYGLLRLAQGLRGLRQDVAVHLQQRFVQVGKRRIQIARHAVQRHLVNLAHNAGDPLLQLIEAVANRG
ncbi:hypothetical protein D3C71_1351250 [compost metagenome]